MTRIDVSLLRETELFLKKDLKTQKLTPSCNRRRGELANRISLEVIRLEKGDTNENDFIAQQREKSRSQSMNSDRASLPLPSIPSASDVSEEIESNYMDLDDFTDGEKSPTHLKLPPGERCNSDGGSGSGYESYASDDDGTSSRSDSKHDLVALFATFNCTAFSYIQLEMTKKFQKGKRWAKRVGVVENNHLKCYKKAGDFSTVLNILLRGYSVITNPTEDGKNMDVVLETLETGDNAYRFRVARDVAEEWAKALKESSGSYVQKGTLKPPPIASRPPHTLASEGRSPSQSSLDIYIGDEVNIIVSDVSSTGSSSSSQNLALTPPTGNSYFGKGIKTMTNIIWKDNKDKNVRKRMATAERLGAKISGYLCVGLSDKWARKWCLINFNQLLVYGKEEAPDITVLLNGCDLLPCTDDREHKFSFKLLRDEKVILGLETQTSEDMGRWVGALIAETGCAVPPSHETYSAYYEPSVVDNIVSASHTSFHGIRGTKSQSDESIYVDLNEAPPSLPARDPIKNLKSPPNFSPSANKRPIKKTQTTPANKKTESKTTKCESNRKIVDEEEKNKQIENNNSNITGNNTNKKDKKKKQAPLLSSSSDKKVLNMSKRKGSLDKKKIERVASKDDDEENVSPEIKELKRKKRDISHKITILDKKLEELQKYIVAAETTKEKIGIRQAVRETKDQKNKLENEELDLQSQIRRLKREKSFDDNNNARRPSIKTCTNVGNVSSKLKIFEAAS